MILTIFTIVALTFIAYFIYGLIKSTSNHPKNHPNWSNPDISYKILKINNNFLVEYNINEEKGTYFIGSSKIDLTNYINHKVNIKGYFPKNYSDNETGTQCIGNSCHKIFNLWWHQKATTSTINIDELRIID